MYLRTVETTGIRLRRLWDFGIAEDLTQSGRMHPQGIARDIEESQDPRNQHGIYKGKHKKSTALQG